MDPRDDLLTLENQLCFALVTAARNVVSIYRPVLEPLGLTHPQYLVMLALWEQAPRSLGELADERPFAVLPLNVSPIIAFAAKGHPAAARATLSLQDLTTWPLVMRERGSRTRQLLEQRAAEQGVCLGYAVEAEGREAVRAIVAAGGGIGFVSAAEFGEDDPRLVRIPLDGPPLLMHEKLICLHERRNSKAIQAFFALARSLRG